MSQAQSHNTHVSSNTTSERLYLYKYLSAQRLDVLKDSRIRFTQPNAFNDPFESRPSMKLFKRKLFDVSQAATVERFGPDLAEQTKRQALIAAHFAMENSPKLMGELFVFLCLSEVPDNLLMWSHYAESHTGFVIAFDAQSRFFASGTHSLSGVTPVSYSRDRYVMPYEGLSGLNEVELGAANTGQFFTKSIDWAYERELRLMASPQKANKSIRFDQGQPSIHLFDFPIEAVRQVTFGCMMPQYKKDEISGLLAEKYPQVSLWQAKINPDKFAVDIIPYSEEQERSRDGLTKMFGFNVHFDDSSSPEAT